MTSPPPQILIVDDELPIRSLLTQTLASRGYQCLKTNTTKRARDILDRQTVALVILDIKMPGESGIALLPHIKEQHPETMVIMATATNDVNTAVSCLKMGAYDYLIKPFNLEELAMSVARALERRRLELENRDYQYNLEQKVEAQSAHIRATVFNAVTALAYALEAKDEYTSGHSQRVARIAGDIAREMGLSPEQTEQVELAGHVHDIGKIGIREAVLNKHGGLTEEEFDHVKRHPEIGERILAPIVDDQEILLIVRHHHEQYDGSGYPDGFAGRRIPLGARIMAAADSYDAMTSGRPYRQAMSAEAAAMAIENGRGTQFDPDVVTAFMRTAHFPGRVRAD